MSFVPIGRRIVRQSLLALCIVLPVTAWSADWMPPTPEELSMTSQPEVPGAAAVYLYRQETTRDLAQAANDSNQDSQRPDFCSTVEPQSPIVNTQPEMDPKLNFQTLYVRLKVLTAEGARYGKIVIDEPEPYWSALKVEGRTIQSDGSIVPFSGRVDRRLISKTRDMLRYVTSFQMPEVRAGSILEYRVTVSYPEYVESPSRWFLQRELFVRKADYYYGPHTWVRKPEESNYGYTSSLPDNVKVIYKQAERSYSLQIANVMPLTGDFAPPPQSQGYRVVFHHTCFPSVMEFWNTHGKWWSSDVDRFAWASKLKSAVAEIAAAGDTEQQKVDKLYAAVAKLQNLSFGSGDALVSNAAAEMKIGNAVEVWSRKQGSSQDLTLLFVGLARAAGLKAYALAVVDRAQTTFDPKDVREEDVDDYLAVVTVDGKEQFFDPGEPFSPPGQLSWRHSFAAGIRQGDGGVVFAQTSGGGYKQSQTQRTVRLQVDRDGSVTGAATLVMTGQPALIWRQRALLDPAEFNEAIAEEVGASLPAGFMAKTGRISGLSDPVTTTAAPPLSIHLDLKGQLPPSAAGEIQVPASLFEARGKQLFTAEKREVPIDFRYASVAIDTVTLTLPTGMKVKSAPADAAIPLGDSAKLVIKETAAPDSAHDSAHEGAHDGAHTAARMIILGKPFYSTAEYPDVKAFYAKVSAADAAQVVVAPGP